MNKKCDQESCQHCSSCQKYQEKAFELEVDEEIEQERLANWWKKYKFVVYGGIFLILATTVGAELYRSTWQKIRIKESDMFEQAKLDYTVKQTDSAIQLFTQLIQEGKTGYKHLAQMELADIYMTKGDTQLALDVWHDMMTSTKTDDPLHYVAIISFVGYQIDSDKAMDLLPVLEPALNHPQFQGLAAEIGATILMNHHLSVQAKSMLESALKNNQLSADNRARLENLLGNVETK